MADADTAPADQPAGSGGNTFADRLNHLFETVYPIERGSPYTDAEVARAVDVSKTYIGNLRKGRSTNPGYELIKDLADFFKVPVAAFFDGEEGEEVRRNLHLLGALKEAGVRQIALRTVASLPDEALGALVPMLEHLGKSDGTRGRMRPRHTAASDGPDTPAGT
ncbi:helix-turn-helix transcriptional regulator [Streptomyces sp. NPDC059176]|uniref:helix-turn-helix transcriptional regulator n=1 Tax=unclassified Streptomyces TaxID=2593676 RepID=UPI0036953669